MSTKLPYVNQPGSMIKILERARHAHTPERFTTDFLETKLGFRGGNYRQFIPLAKKLGLLGSDGKPTETYKSFRNTATSGAAIATAMRTGYKEIFERNEYANGLNKEQLKGLVVEITGLDSGNRVVQLICNTFEALKKLANFEARTEEVPPAEHSEDPDGSEERERSSQRELDLNLSYTINLVLPKSEDPAVFTAIFKALRENLLRN